MNKTKPPRNRLDLNRETIRRLGADQLRRAGGGRAGGGDDGSVNFSDACTNICCSADYPISVCRCPATDWATCVPTSSPCR